MKKGSLLLEAIKATTGQLGVFSTVMGTELLAPSISTFPGCHIDM